MTWRSALIFASILLATPSFSQVIEPAPIQLAWIKQKTPSDCGRAVLASLLSHRNSDIESVYRKIPDPKDDLRGYSILEMTKHARMRGLDLKITIPHGKSAEGRCRSPVELDQFFSDLADATKRGRPFIVPISDESTSGHYLLLTGFENGQFKFHDPADPEPRTATASELSQMMCNFGYIALEVKRNFNSSRKAPVSVSR